MINNFNLFLNNLKYSIKLRWLKIIKKIPKINYSYKNNYLQLVHILWKEGYILNYKLKIINLAKLK